MFYSANTGGFYTREIHGDNIPADAVEITTEEHAALIEGQSQGKRIVADANGYPVLQDPPVEEPTLQDLIARKIRAIDAKRDEILKAGKLYAGLHVALLDKKGTDGPRADLSGMATNAIGVLIGLPGITWPESYQDGWIAVENERIPLPTPQDGLALAQACAAYFAAVVQCARDKKDACLAAEDETALDAVSIEDGWPANDDPVE